MLHVILVKLYLQSFQIQPQSLLRRSGLWADLCSAELGWACSVHTQVPSMKLSDFMSSQLPAPVTCLHINSFLCLEQFHDCVTLCTLSAFLLYYKAETFLFLSGSISHWLEGKLQKIFDSFGTSHRQMADVLPYKRRLLPQWQAKHQLYRSRDFFTHVPTHRTHHYKTNLRQFHGVTRHITTIQQHPSHYREEEKAVLLIWSELLDCLIHDTLCPEAIMSLHHS